MTELKFDPHKMRHTCDCGSVAFNVVPVFTKDRSGQEKKVKRIYTCKDCHKSYEVKA
jgi:hypothetical protein